MRPNLVLYLVPMAAPNIKPITYMKTRAAELVSSVNDTGNPVVITQNGEARAVVLDLRSYQRLQDALLMLKMIAQSNEDFRKGRWKTHQRVTAEMETRFRR